MEKNQLANTGEARVTGLVSELERSPGVGNGDPLAWKIPWTEEPSGLKSKGSQRSDMTEHTHTNEETVPKMAE